MATKKPALKAAPKKKADRTTLRMRINKIELGIEDLSLARKKTPAKRPAGTIAKSSKSGRIVTEKFAAHHPATTVHQTVRRGAPARAVMSKWQRSQVRQELGMIETSLKPVSHMIPNSAEFVGKSLARLRRLLKLE